jgi:hypothetical protein
MMATSGGSSGWIPAGIEIQQDQMTLQVGAARTSVPVHRLPNGERNGLATLAELAGRAAQGGIFLRCCAGCRRFSFSGLAFQFSGGTQGYCALAGRRDPDLSVAIGFGCGEHEPIEGWPADLSTVERVRLDLTMRPRPVSRLPAIEGALFGAVAACESVAGSKAAHSVASGIVAVSDAMASSDFSDVSAGSQALEDRLADTFSAGESFLGASVPIGLAMWRSPDRTREVARAVASRIAPASEAEFVASAFLASLAMRKRSPREMSAALTAGVSSGADAASSMSRAEDSQDPIGGALECLRRSPEDYVAAVSESLRTAGTNHAIVLLTGALSGAFNGVASIPLDWRARVVDADALREAAQLFVQRGRET